MEEFVEAVSKHFGLGRPGDARVTEMQGSANRLWRFDTGVGSFVVKELSHDAPKDLERRRTAAAFERAVFDQQQVQLPEPIFANDGEIVAMLVGSRGVPCPVRVHRWVDDEQALVSDPEFLRDAGVSLGRIQQAGRGCSRRPDGSLRWWDEEPLVVIDRLVAADLLPDAPDSLRSVTESVLELLDTAEKLDGEWVYSHCDHKPENSLRVAGRPTILDWDECGHIHPRLEAVEAALRWAGGREPEQAAFGAFLDGYGEVAEPVEALVESDFAKWLAALLGWFTFQGRRALGDWPTETAEERSRAWTSAARAWQGLKASLTNLPDWAGWR